MSAPAERPGEAARFWAKVQKGRPGECWIWTGSKDRKGYGRFCPGKARVLAYHWSLEDRYGAFPRTLSVDHLCDTPACVNPEHMALVPMRENILRGTSPSAVNARKTQCPRGHALKTLYQEASPQRRCPACADISRRSYRQRRRTALAAAREGSR